MKQIKIFSEFVDFESKLEKVVNEWLTLHTEYAILDIKQSISGGNNIHNKLVITVFYEVPDQLEKVKIKQKEYSNNIYKRNYEDLNDNEYMSR